MNPITFFKGNEVAVCRILEDILKSINFGVTQNWCHSFGYTYKPMGLLQKGAIMD
jgi:hypothetical protein